ncbi:MAG: hypothetical protein ACI97A_001914 [Planctomycetota bacterium]|jgi:hypothetical protein
MPTHRKNLGLILIALVLYVFADVAIDSENNETTEVDHSAPSIQVADENGAIIPGVPIALVSRFGGMQRILWHGRAGESSLAAPIAMAYDENYCDQYRWALGFPVMGADFVDHEPRQPTFSPITLKMPKTGNIVIDLIAHDGKPFSGELDVHCVGGLPGRVRDREIISMVVPYKTKVEGAQLVIPYVGLGLELRVDLSDPRGHRPQTSIFVDGPTKPSESVRSRVKIAKQQIVVRGRLEFESPVDLGGRTFEATIEGVNYQSDYSGLHIQDNVPIILKVALEDDGSFELVWPDSGNPTGKRKLIIAEDINSERAPSGFTAELLISKTGLGRVLDVGAVKVKTGTFKFEGRVVDDSGRGIKNVRVHAAGFKRAVGSWGRLRRGPWAGFGITDEDGWFQIYSTSDAIEYRIKAAPLGGIFTLEHKVTLGDDPPRIVIPSRSSVKGNIKLVDPMDAWLIGLATRRVDEKAKADQKRGRQRSGVYTRTTPLTAKYGGIKRDGSFEISMLNPGAHVLEVMYAGKVVQTVGRFEIARGEKLTPQALRDIELVNRPRLVRVQVNDEEGKPLSGRRVYTTWRREGPRRNRPSSRPEMLDEQGTFIATYLWPDETTIPIVVAGYSCADVPIESNDISVNLIPGPIIEVELTDFADLAPNGEILSATLKQLPDDRRAHRSDSKQRAFPISWYRQRLRGGKTTFRVHTTGRHFLDIRRIPNAYSPPQENSSVHGCAVDIEESDQEIILDSKDR